MSYLRAHSLRQRAGAPQGRSAAHGYSYVMRSTFDVGIKEVVWIFYGSSSESVGRQRIFRH